MRGPVRAAWLITAGFALTLLTVAATSAARQSQQLPRGSVFHATLEYRGSALQLTADYGSGNDFQSCEQWAANGDRSDTPGTRSLAVPQPNLTQEGAIGNANNGENNVKDGITFGASAVVESYSGPGTYGKLQLPDGGGASLGKNGTSSAVDIQDAGSGATIVVNPDGSGSFEFSGPEITATNQFGGGNESPPIVSGALTWTCENAGALPVTPTTIDGSSGHPADDTGGVDTTFLGLLILGGLAIIGGGVWFYTRSREPSAPDDGPTDEDDDDPDQDDTLIDDPPKPKDPKPKDPKPNDPPDDGRTDEDDDDPDQDDTLIDDPPKSKDPKPTTPTPVVPAGGTDNVTNQAKNNPKSPRRFALLVGVGFPTTPEEKQDPVNCKEAIAIRGDADILTGALVDGWGFPERDVKTRLNQDARKLFIEQGFDDLLGKVKNLPPQCDSCYVKIHFQGHATRMNPANATDILKGVAVPNMGGKTCPAFRTWDDDQGKGGKGLFFDFELEAKVLQIRDALEAQKKKPNSKLNGTNSQVIVQVDTCFAQSMLGGLIGAAGVSTAWSTKAGETQGFMGLKGSPWVHGFSNAFSSDGGVTIDPKKGPTIEEAHAAAGANANAEGPKMNPNPFQPGADYGPHAQTPAMRPGN